MKRQEKIEKCEKWFKTLNIGDTITDVKYNRDNKITNMTSNSLELYLTKVSDKGINCYQYYTINDLVDLTIDWMEIKE